MTTISSTTPFRHDPLRFRSTGPLRCGGGWVGGGAPAGACQLQDSRPPPWRRAGTRSLPAGGVAGARRERIELDDRNVKSGQDAHSAA